MSAIVSSSSFPSGSSGLFPRTLKKVTHTQTLNARPLLPVGIEFRKIKSTHHTLMYKDKTYQIFTIQVTKGKQRAY